MANKGLKVVLESEVTDKSMRKLEHYYGIEFVRGASNGGGDNGYHAMIGDASLLRELRFHNQMKIVSVKDAEIQSVLNQTNWNKTEGGANAVLDGTDGADIMQVHTKDVYAILGGTDSTYERYIVSDQPFNYMGDEAKLYEAGGETPDYVTLLNGVVRSIRNDGVAGTHAAGNGRNHSNSDYGTDDANGYPRNSLTRFQYEQYARAKNSDPNTNLPYTNICHQDIELAFAFMAIECRTKIFTNVFGHAISSNASPDATNWGRVSGFRMTSDGGATYQYKTFGANIFLNGSTTGTQMRQVLNGACPNLKMFEAQLAISNGDAVESVKDADGNDMKGINDGVMTCIWTKRFTFKVNAALTAGGETHLWDVECVLRVPVWRGRSRLWGNCSQWYSGYELLKYLGEDNKTHHAVFRAPSVSALMTDSDVTDKNLDESFAFEDIYERIGELPALTADGGGWGTKMLSVDGITTALIELAGGGIATHEQANLWAAAGALADKKQRRGALLGGDAHETLCVLRYADGLGAPSRAGSIIGGGFRVTLA